MSRQRNLDADLKESQQIEIHRQSKNIDDVNADGTQSVVVLAILGKIKKSTFKFFSLSIYLSIYLFIYICNHEDNVLSRLSSQWFYVNPCTWTDDVVSTWCMIYELPQSHYGDNWKGGFFSWWHIHYTHLTSVRFEHSVCRGSRKS